MRKTTLIYLLNDNWQILLSMKKRGFGVGKWNGSWWKLENWETVEQAAVRELSEENWIILQTSDLNFKWVLHFTFEWKEDWNQSVYVFFAKFNWEWVETEEMKPQWWNISQIPYEQMWESDKIWLPRILDWEKDIEYNITFSIEWKLLDYKMIK